MVRTWPYALFLAAGYALLAAVYIVVSSRIAANASANIEDLRRIETLKGVVYVAVTALAVFFGAWAAMSRLERAHAEIRRRNAAILASEQRVLAGLLAAGTAHDANNVLMCVLNDLEMLGESRGADPRIERLKSAVERLTALNRRLMEAARQNRLGETQPVRVLEEVRASIASVGSHRRMRSCAVSATGDEDLVVRAHRLLLHQIVVNLVVNAADAVPEEGHIEVRVERGEGGASIEVHDDGPGVPRERWAGLFDALETTKPTGSGLGLFSVKACAEAMGGSVEVGASPLGGACFRVAIPESVTGRGVIVPLPPPSAAGSSIPPERITGTG